MEPRRLAEDDRSDAPSSWWALETPVTLTRCGSDKRPSGGHGDGSGAIGRQIGPQPPSLVYFNTARHEGHQISEMWQELEEEVRLPEGSGRSCLEGIWSAAVVRVGQDRVRRPPRYPRCRPGPTGRHRRGQVRQEYRHKARSRCCVRESMKTVADGGIVSSDPPAEDRDDFRRLRPQGRLRRALGVFSLAVSPFT